MGGLSGSLTLAALRDSTLVALRDSALVALRCGERRIARVWKVGTERVGMELQGVLELGDGDFVGGVKAAYGLEARERTRQKAAIAVYHRKFRDLSVGKEELQAATDATVYAGPLWLRVLGFDPTIAGDVEPEQRRLGIRRLVRVVERMYRAELKREDRGNEVAPDMNDEACSYDKATALWDPVPEICAYLGIAASKLSGLCREQTGLRVQELGDCIRTEGLKARLRDRLRELGREWHASLDGEEQGRLAKDWRMSAWRFVRWVRGRGRGESRKRLALELGVPTAARLGRAAFVVSRETLEELELSVAMEVVKELVEPRGTTVVEPLGAELSDVGDVGCSAGEDCKGVSGVLGRESRVSA